VRIFLLTTLVCAAALMTSGCTKKEAQLTPTKPVDVVVAPAVIREITDFEDFTGRLEAIHRIDIRAQVKGYLRKVHFKEGEEVPKGALLFEIDPTTYKAEFEFADATVDRASKRARQLKSDLERARVLWAKKSINAEDLEKATADYVDAVAAEKVAMTSRTKAEINLNYTKIYAEPVGGATGRAMIDPGNFVEAEKTVLTTLVSYNPIYAYFDVDERTLLARDRRRISEGKSRTIEVDAKVLLALSDEKDFEHLGVVDFVDNAVNPGTGTKRMRAVFNNPKKLLSPGLFVRVRYPIGMPHPAVVIPERAISSDQGQKFVYIVDKDNEVVYRRVRTGSQIKDYRVIEEARYKQKDNGSFELSAEGKKIIMEGLEEGEKVIVSGIQRVRPRTKVQYKAPEAVPPDAGVSHLSTVLKTQLLRERSAAPAKTITAAP
jgi:RND family efflux transporter MFP subunit